jgi:hypothetical protein
MRLLVQSNLVFSDTPLAVKIYSSNLKHLGGETLSLAKECSFSCNKAN